MTSRFYGFQDLLIIVKNILNVTNSLDFAQFLRTQAALLFLEVTVGNIRLMTENVTKKKENYLKY